MSDAPTGIRLEPASELRANWAAPRPPRPGWLRFGVPVAAIALVLAVVHALGGFATRQWDTTYLAPGDPITIGNAFEFTPLEALGTQDSNGAWKIAVLGRCRNITNKAFSTFQFTSEVFAVGDPATRRLGKNPELSFGSWALVTSLPELSPGADEPCRIDARFADLGQTGQIVLLGSQAENADQSLAGYGRTAWEGRPPTYVWLLPLSVNV